jgi:hypothetical protein
MTRVNRCIFCKEDSKDSKSVEHIIPESLGSYKVVLPAGIVCDKCNNYFARKVENPLLSNESFRNVRAWYQVPTKKGKYPSVKGEIAGTDVNINIKLDKEKKLELNPEKLSEKEMVDNFDINVNPLIFKIDINPPKELMARFMAKMGLEYLAYRYMKHDSGIEHIVEHEHFDRIREFARFNKSQKSWPISRRVIYPVETQMKHSDTDKWIHAGFGYDLMTIFNRETYFCFSYYGVEFVINLGGPSLDGFNRWLELHNDISPLIERVGSKLIEKNENGTKKYYLDGDCDLSKGYEFDRKHNLNENQ